ncbi:hypothetical protein AAG906_036982 [Vitis piasezkii]
MNSEEESVSLGLLKKKMVEFAKEMYWDQFHSPRNLLLALRRGAKGASDWKEDEKQYLKKEVSDVLLYLVRLSDICGIDLGKAALRKVDPNAIKYPVSKTNFYSEGS